MQDANGYIATPFTNLYPLSDPTRVQYSLFHRSVAFIKDWFNTMGTHDRRMNWLSFKAQSEYLCSQLAGSADRFRHCQVSYRTLRNLRREFLEKLWAIFSYLKTRELRDNEVTKEFIAFTNVPYQTFFYAPFPEPAYALELEEEEIVVKEEADN